MFFIQSLAAKTKSPNLGRANISHYFIPSHTTKTQNPNLGRAIIVNILFKTSHLKHRVLI